MLNWLVVSNNDVKENNQQTDTKNDPVTVNTEILNLLPKELLNEITEFDIDDLSEVDESERYYFYDLLDEIVDGVQLNHVEIKKSTYSTFLSKMKHSLDTLIVNRRIKNFGKDNQFAYTDEEYEYAYKQLTGIEIANRYRRTIAVGFSLFIASSIGIVIENNFNFFCLNKFLSGVYLTNVLLFGSFILNTIYG